MEIPKVIEELILSYVWAIEHPTCKLVRDERKRLRNFHENGLMPHPEVFAHPRAFHDDSFFPYDTFVDQEYNRVSRHFFAGMDLSTSESFYCHRCGENYTELDDTDPIDRCECWVYDYATISHPTLEYFFL